ncbi:hypothetical protein [Telluria antibiotica]|nr:hypothetical protein [Telluria antibiotica]
MPTFASTNRRRLAWLARVLLHLLAARPAHRYPRIARPGSKDGL